MDDGALKVFVDGTVRYFEQAGDRPAEVGSPYLIGNSATVAKDFTGIIGVSGKYRGSVYFTADRAMLRVLLMALGETDTSHENLCDLVGEIANTLAGNARQKFGKGFMISVPVVIVGEPEKIVVPEHLRSFVIPIKWRSYEAALVVSVE